MTKFINIIEPISITLNNTYRLNDWEREIIVKCIRENPSSKMPELGKLLGISERALYRRLNKYKLILASVKCNYLLNDKQQKAK